METVFKGIRTACKVGCSLAERVLYSCFHARFLKSLVEKYDVLRYSINIKQKRSWFIRRTGYYIIGNISETWKTS